MSAEPPLVLDSRQAEAVWQALATAALVEDEDHLRDGFVAGLCDGWSWPEDERYFDLDDYRGNRHAFDLSLSRGEGVLRLQCWNDVDYLELDSLIADLNETLATLSAPGPPQTPPDGPRHRLSALAD